MKNPIIGQVVEIYARGKFGPSAFNGKKGTVIDVIDCDVLVEIDGKEYGFRKSMLVQPKKGGADA